jgi:LacI family transcriptional regulator
MSTNLLEHPNVPRYVKLAEQWGNLMRSGQLKPGDRLPSFAEMKARHGLSQNTVERAHAILEQRGLIVREQGRGTFVAQPRTERKARTGIIGVCGLGFNFVSYSIYWAKLFQGVRQAADETQVQVLTVSYDSTAGWEKVDGILLASWTAEPILQRMPPFLPHVSMMVPLENVASVAIDEGGGARAATEYLLARGHRRIAFLHSKDPIHTSLRLAAYRDALWAAGIEPDERWHRQMLSPYIEAQDFIVSGRRTMQEWLADDWHELGCTALLAQNDETAMGAIEALQNVGLRVPEDISVIGFDGTEICNYFKPRLTSVEAPLREVGRRAAQLLLQQIENDDAPATHEVLPMRLVERETVSDCG